MTIRKKLGIAALATFGATTVAPVDAQDIYNPDLDEAFVGRIEAEAQNNVRERKLAPIPAKLHVLQYLVDSVENEDIEDPDGPSKEQLPCAILRVAGRKAYQTGIEATKQLDMISAQLAFTLAQKTGELAYYRYDCALPPDPEDESSALETEHGYMM